MTPAVLHSPVDRLVGALLFHPDPAPVRSVRQFFPAGQDVRLRTEDGVSLGAWLIPPSGEGRDATVLFAPGNAGHREDRAELLGHLAGAGFRVLAMDYRGYGGNPGRPSEAGLARDARAAADWLAARGYPPQRTIYAGESLGCAVLARLATTRRPAGMVLRSPFSSLADVAAVHLGRLAVPRLLAGRFPVAGLMDPVLPVSVIRGTTDEIVPQALSAEVATACGALVADVVIQGAGHNDEVMYGPLVADVVSRLADHCLG